MLLGNRGEQVCPLCGWLGVSIRHHPAGGDPRGVPSGGWTLGRDLGKGTCQEETATEK